MSLTNQEAAALTASREAFDAADQSTINALKEMTGLSQTARCKWVSPFNIAIDVSTLTPGEEDIIGVVAQLAEKDILMVFRMGHKVTCSYGPKHGSQLEITFRDNTSHTVTTVVSARDAVAVNIAIATPVNTMNSSRAAAGGFR